MGRSLSYLLKTINVYNLYVEIVFHVDAGHYPLYCLTKRHDNEEEDIKSQLIVLIKYLNGKFNIRPTYSFLLLFLS